MAGAFDASARVTGADGKVAGDGDFVFHNRPDAPGVRLPGDALAVDPARPRGGACRVTVVAGAAVPGTPLGRLPTPRLDVTGRCGRAVAGFAPHRPGPESVLPLAGLFHRPGTGWKLRAVGQGYADALAGLARDFGVDTADAGGQTAAAAPQRPAGPGPSPVPDEFTHLVNSARARAGRPPVVPDPRPLSAARAHARAMADGGRTGGGRGAAGRARTGRSCSVAEPVRSVILAEWHPPGHHAPHEG
ncbi:TerD family protein [Streptomyces flaveolus]|uniref:TerD family protein n=1 Tax=Streptomyces flaveolus TaxID=67297 RepID=UPI003F541FC4